MKIRSILSDLMILAGIIALEYGLWQLNPTTAWITGGVLGIGFGLLLGLDRGSVSTETVNPSTKKGGKG